MSAFRRSFMYGLLRVYKLTLSPVFMLFGIRTDISRLISIVRNACRAGLERVLDDSGPLPAMSPWRLVRI